MGAVSGFLQAVLLVDTWDSTGSELGHQTASDYTAIAAGCRASVPSQEDHPELSKGCSEYTDSGCGSVTSCTCQLAQDPRSSLAD